MSLLQAGGHGLDTYRMEKQTMRTLFILAILVTGIIVGIRSVSAIEQIALRKVDTLAMYTK